MAPNTDQSLTTTRTSSSERALFPLSEQFWPEIDGGRGNSSEHHDEPKALPRS
jgi:hypothetical protein